MSNPAKEQSRFDFVDQFRGFIGVLMLLGHTSYYFNSIWKQLDPFDPLFPSWGQFMLRYAGYLCAPGFLMMAGAMVWWSYSRRVAKGATDWNARWHFIQRGLILVLIQMIWVNSSWGGFKAFQPWHLGIIASIGISMIFLTLIIKTRWYVRLIAAIALLLIHPFLLKIGYSDDIAWQEALMQTFVDAGDFNKYPVMPWLALAILGSVMANGWLKLWKTDRMRIGMSLGIAATAFLLAIFIRLQGGFGNIAPAADFMSYSFLIDQKYPPSLFMNLWFFGMVVTGVTLFIIIGKISPKLLKVFSIPGKVPMFFYAVHLAILGVFTRIFPEFYRNGDVSTAFIGLAGMLIIMLPLCKWFYGVKLRSKNYFIQMI